MKWYKEYRLDDLILRFTEKDWNIFKNDYRVVGGFERASKEWWNAIGYCTTFEVV